MKHLAAAAVLVIAAVMVATPVHTAPRPSEVSSSWQLDIHIEGAPKAINVVLPGQTVAKRFWFLRYTVTNSTGEDRIYVPEATLATDTGQILRAGQKVPSAVFRAIKELYNEPLLKDMTEMTGKLLQGEDNARDGVAIWPDFDPQAGSFDIFMGGLSGETAVVDLPSPLRVVEIDSQGREKVVEKKQVVLSRTLDLGYSIPGEAAARGEITPKEIRREWVMR